MNILRQNNLSTTELLDDILGNVVNYVQANQGGLFLYNDETDTAYLELASCYAYERKKFSSKRIEIGEGLVGQCFLEKEYIYLTDIPAEYVHITSGLGQATPTSILIIPLTMNDNIEGILELASFRNFKEYEIEFLLKLCENIGSTLYNIKGIERTEKLLEQAKEQEKTLRLQEEEMKQSMEELQATQESLVLKTQEIERVKKEESERAEKVIEEQSRELQEKMESLRKINEMVEQKSKEIEIKAKEAEKARELSENQKILMVKQLEKMKVTTLEAQKAHQDLAAIEEELRQNMAVSMEKQRTFEEKTHSLLQELELSRQREKDLLLELKKLKD